MQSGGTLAAHDISFHRGAQAVLDGLTFTVPPRSRTGIVGPNGIGKSTLLRVLAGLEPPDAGHVARRPSTLQVGYVPQERDLRSGETLHGYLARRTGVAEAERRMDELATALETESHRVGEYTDALETFLARGGDDLPARAGAVIADLGLAVALDRPSTGLSGGEAARAALAALVLARFDVYLLDEPTNDLDFEGLERLEEFVGESPAGFVIVSHDRVFLDRSVTRIMEFEPGTGRTAEFTGGWSDYEEARDRARERHERDYVRHDEERRRWIDAQQERRQQARSGGAQANRRGTHALMSRARAASKRLERLERNRVEKPWAPWRLQLALAPRERSGELVVALEHAVIARDGFRLGPIDLTVTWAERVAIVGPNGSGKTTLLEAALGRLSLAGGRRAVGPSVVFGEIAQGRKLFDRGEPLLGLFVDRSGLDESEARTLLAKFDLYSEHVLRPASTLSPGERTRATLALEAARGANCLVLDEPTNHLDLSAIEELEAALADYTGTLLLVTHDRRFLERVAVTRTVAL
ncbi:MAG: ABC-F family ATP-binding cassette domain-containing protein [Actinobacteria bacterium]|nr:ABC-F family ATP-binding cassette domain-containing protein [Actinomycetota bacterium]